jgi:response regulator RpfG family c-di-GMP phosphodiesterase
VAEDEKNLVKVLLIDDEADVVRFFEKVFQNFKHIRFFAASKARQGMELARVEKPKVVLMDLRMPEMSGEEALKELKPILPETKFIVMTGWDDGRTKERILNEIGVAAYFDKPVDLERVLAKVFECVMTR